MDEVSEYVAVFVTALQTNRRHLGKISTHLEQMKKTLGKEGTELYKKELDAAYDSVFLDKRIIELQIKAIRWLVEEYNKKSILQVTKEELSEKYGSRIDGMCNQKMLKIQKPLLGFLVAFVEFLKKKEKGELNGEIAGINVSGIV